MHMAEVVLKNLKKIYPNTEKKKKKGEPEKKNDLQITDEGVVAVQDFNLHIADKEFIVLVGPSGCGKSTTLRMIAGLEDISGGELYIDGKLMNDVEPKDRDIAMVFQSYALYPHMTVYENMAFGLRVRRTAPGEIDARVREAARILEISHLLDRRPAALSGGQKQRLCIARALLKKPKILILDEATANIDSETEAIVQNSLAKMRQGRTTIAIAHRLSTIQDANCIYVLDKGRIIEHGSHEELLALGGTYHKMYSLQAGAMEGE